MTVPDRSPVASVEPSRIEVELGETVSATVTATDPDKDSISLEKVLGPGTLDVKGNAGEASGSYSWAASGTDPWELVGFRAADPCGTADMAYLLIHVLQPPRVHPGFHVFAGAD